MSQLFGDWNQAKMAAAIYLTLPGTPFIYSGEEIGMQGRGEHENIREPFKWYELDGPGQTAWRSSLFNTGRWQPSVESQDGDPGSLLNHYRRLIHLRLSEPALQLGSLSEVDCGDNPRIIAYVRRWQDELALVVHNISRQEQEVLLTGVSLPGEILFASGPYSFELDGPGCSLVLAPCTTVIWK